MRASSLVKLTLVVGVVSVLFGCTSLFNPTRNVTPPPAKLDSAPAENFQPLSALGESCSTTILEPDRSSLLQEALADSQLQAVKARLEARGLAMNTNEAQTVQLVGGVQVLIPFGEDAHLVWTRTNGQTAAVGLVRQGNKTLNLATSGEERIVRFLPAQKVQNLLTKLRQKPKFQEFEQRLSQRGKRVGKIQVLFDETRQLAILGIANKGSEKIAHQVRIKVKANKDDEPEDTAEPAIQATACGQASGEVVPTGATMQPLTAPPWEGGDVGGGYEGPQICTSQWGYNYFCISRTPMLSISLTGLQPSLAIPQTFITQQSQASFIIWNSGGGTLSGTVTTSAPFSIVSGGSFSLRPGQPQEVVVKFSSATPGSFSKSVTISSNGGSQAVTATSVAHKVSFSPAQLDFGSGLLVLTEQCNSMGVCGLRTEKVWLPIEKTLTVKNEGTVSVTLSLSTSAPYKIVSALPTLSPGQSGQVTLRFDPSESGSFTGNVQVSLPEGHGSLTAGPMTGVAHKIEISPAELNFGIVLVSSTKERKLVIKNQGITTVTVDTPNTTMTSPFRVVLDTPLILGPSESKDVPVQVSPTVSGDLQGSVRLIIGTVFKEILAAGKAYTEEEYINLLRQSLNATCQALDESQGPRNIQYVPGPDDQDFLFYRMPCPTDEELDALLEFLMAIEDPTDDIILEQLTDQMRDSLLIVINALFSVAKNKLATTNDPDAINGAILAEYFKIVLSTDPKYDGFDKFLAMLQASPTLNVIAALKTAVRAAIGKLIQKYTPPLPSWAGYAWTGINILYALFNLDPPTGLTLKEWEAHQFTLSMVTIMAIFPNGENAIKNVIQSTVHQGVGGRDSRLEAMAVIVFTGVAVLGITFAEELPQAIGGTGLTLPFFDEFLKWVATVYGPNSAVESLKLYHYMNYLAKMAMSPIISWETYANEVGGFIAFAALGQAGWAIVGGFGWSPTLITLPGLPAGLHVVATNIIDGRRVTVFVHVEAKLGESEVTNIATKIEEITQYARRFTGTTGTVVEGSYAVTVLIAFNVDPDAVDQLVAKLQGKNLQTPVLILYPEGEEWKWRCVGDCSDKQFLDAVAAALSQALGTPYSGGNENTLGEMLNILDQAMAAAEYFYGYGNPALAWHLAFGICEGDFGCILFLAEALIEQMQEECRNPSCPIPMSSPLFNKRPDQGGGR